MLNKFEIDSIFESNIKSGSKFKSKQKFKKKFTLTPEIGPQKIKKILFKSTIGSEKTEVICFGEETSFKEIKKTLGIKFGISPDDFQLFLVNRSKDENK